MSAGLDRIAAHITGAQYSDLGAADLAKARIFLLDTFGVGIAGSCGASVPALVQTVSGWGAGEEATVWVTGERLPAQAAAIVNAYQIHCLEYDCVHEGAVVHPMATVLSALMAYVERRSAQGRPVNGQDFLLALAIGVDIATLLGVASKGPVRFFRPATAGGFGATAAIARLEGLDAGGVKNALGVMYGQTSGTLQPHTEGSPVLGLQIGFNARGALSAVDLAAAGLVGPHDILDGPYGYFRMIEGDQFDLDEIWSRMGHEWQISQLAHKPFPSGRLTHGVVHALQQVTQSLGIGANDIQSITGHVPPLVHRLVGRPDKADPSTNYAKLCLAYVAGAYLVRRQVDVTEFRSEALSDPEIHAQAAKVTLHLDGNPDENALDPQRFVFDLKDGRRHEVALPYVLGHPKAPLSDDQNLAKFRRCIGYAATPMSEAQGRALEDAVSGVTDLEDAALLAQLTVVQG